MASRKQNQHLLEQIYSFIKEYKKNQHGSPTFEEIRKAIGIKSVSLFESYLYLLDEQGLIVYPASKKHRSIKLVKDDFFEDIEPISNISQQNSSVRVEGTIAAGQLIEKFSDTEQTLNISSAQAREDTYALLVKGQSMIEDHICDGDYVIVRRQHIYQNGDIIVATHNLSGSKGSATLKHFSLNEEEKAVYLKPANSEFAPIVVSMTEWEQEWEIQGKLLAILRTDRKL